MQKKLKILLCNDDGYTAPGILALKKALEEDGHQITLVAPCGERSGYSQAVTFFSPVQTKMWGGNVYSVTGTPADSVCIALADILKDYPPDVVISGINNGFNVGRDVNYSGTVGAASEAAFAGFKAIAVSVDRIDLTLPESAQLLQNVAQFVVKVVNRLSSVSFNEHEVLNINFPKNEPLGIKVGRVNNVSLYQPCVEKLPINHPHACRMGVYLIGGEVRQDFYQPSMADDDVYLVLQGYAVISLLDVRKSVEGQQVRLQTLLDN